MTSALPVGSAPQNTRTAASPDERLRKSALQLEAVFVERLFAAMRETVPEGGVIERSNAESMFTSMLDQRVSEEAPLQWKGSHSLAEALYNQLRQRLVSQTTDQHSSRATEASR